MIYRITHRTTYRYKYPVSLGNHVACLTPRSLAHHRCDWNQLRIHPSPATRSERRDYFGNELSYFTIKEPHSRLIVESRSEVTVDDGPDAWSQADMPWEQVVRCVARGRSPENLEAYQFVFESPRIRPNGDFGEYARRSFLPGRSYGESLLDLTDRIYREFRFDAKATNVRTTTEDVFRKKRGVCQDFAHLQIALLRSLELPARYVSGYLRTYPPPGRPRLVGADASHAWAAGYCPGAGWLPVDPTNNLVPSKSHVMLGWGRDYGDVSPLRGLILGGRDHTLKVAVDMEPVEDTES